MNYVRTRQAHRLLALLLAVFIVSHLMVHFAVVFSAEAHLAVLAIVQKAYRQVVLEALLMVAIGVQIVLGGYLLKTRWRLPNKDIWVKLQIASGLYLMFFLLLHSSAALLTHHVFDLETDFYWAAATVHIKPLKYFFIPYYFLAVSAVFCHLATALHFASKSRPTKGPSIMILVGMIYAAVIIAGFAGVYYEIEIPQAYIDNFDKYMPF